MSTSPERPRIDVTLPFTRAEARAAGIDIEMLLSRRFHKVLYDLYVCRTVVITPVVRARAALKVAPEGARISHQTAAEIWGAAVPADQHVHLTMPSQRGRLVRRGVKSHYAASPVEARGWKGLPISSPEQVFLELAAGGLCLVDLVIVADGLVKAKRTSLEALRSAAEEFGGRNCRVARRAAGLARKDVDSPQETRLRLLVVLAGLPEPRVNLVVRATDGSWKRRYDMAYEALQLILEYDGRQHSEDAEQWHSDIYRREELDRRHWRLVIVTSEGIYRDPLNTLNRVRAALVECGATNLRPRFRDEWRLHFPPAS